MMALTITISNAETSTDPKTGLLTGDADPASTQAGLVTKLRDSQTQINTDIAALKTIFDDHDHDATNPTGPGGPPVGSNGAHSIDDAAVTGAKIGSGAVTGPKTAADALGTSNVTDDSIETAQLGEPSVWTRSIAAGGSATFTHNKGRRLQFFIAGGIASVSVTDNAIAVSNPSVDELTFSIYYRGAP